MSPRAGKYAYCTLITRASYLAGVIILAHTLKKNNCAFPLIVLYTDTLPFDSVRALQLEAPKTNLILRPVSALLPRENVHVHLIAERFADTWTKLRVFELYQVDDYDVVCYLDADMIVCQNPDQIFNKALPASDWIAANHACVCNLDHDPWAPSDWSKENCAYTPLNHPTALTSPTPVKPDSRPTHHLLNSGMFLFCPSEPLWERMLDFFNTTPLLSEFKFPDQDFLAEFFRNKWTSLGWQFNALKTMRYWHENIWRDEEVVVLHYIVDKPWASRIGDDGRAGYLGRDGATHKWWWEVYEEWKTQRERDGQDEVLKLVKSNVKGLPGDEGDESEDMRAIGSKVQAFATNKKPSTEPDQPVKQSEHVKDEEAGTESTVSGIRKKVLGERGHGPRLRGGSSNMIP